MSSIAVSFLVVIGMLGLIALRMPIGLALGMSGFIGVWVLLGLDTAVYALQTGPVEALSSATLSVLPLFILMGLVSVRIGFSTSLFTAANAFVGHRRGGLAIASVMSCAGFGAVCGSSLATVATMAKVAVPEMLRFNYSPKLAAGSIAAGGTLGILIPPSLPMIVYAVLTENSIGQLFAAGFLPGIIATGLYMAAVTIWMRFAPEMGPAGARAAWPERFRALSRIWGVLVIFTVVMGGILLGLFSPTEGAAVGSAAAIALGVQQRRLTVEGLIDCLLDTIRVCGMILFVVAGASIFDYFMQASQMGPKLADFFTGLDVEPFWVMAIIIAVLIVFGMFLDTMAILFILTPVIYPIVIGLGFDPIWFGIIMIMVVEIGLITPPIGINIFVVAKVVPQVSTWGAFQGVTPFIVADIIRIALFLIFPGLVLFLPALLQ